MSDQSRYSAKLCFLRDILGIPGQESPTEKLYRGIAGPRATKGFPVQKILNMINRTNIISVKSTKCKKEEEDLVSDMIAPRTEKTKHIFGSVKVGERGQIVIPKEAREIFNIKQGDILLVLGDVERGIALVKADAIREFARKILDSTSKPDE